MIGIEYYILNPIRLNKIIKLDWLKLWVNKSDYITKYYKSIEGKYKIIDESIDYYIVMLEVGIYYLKDYSDYYDYAYIEHNILLDSVLKEDIKERDIAEYLKYLFYNNYDDNYIYSFIDKCGNKFNYNLVVARLFFPSYYLFYLEKVVISNSDYNKLENIIDQSYEYEKYIIRVVNKMNEFLTKKIILPF